MRHAENRRCNSSQESRSYDKVEAGNLRNRDPGLRSRAAARRGIAVCTRIELLGVEIDPLSLDQAVGQIRAWIAAAEAKCRYVVTPKADHVVLYQQQAKLRAALAQAGLILAGSGPVVWASRLLERPLPGRVTATDLVSALFGAASDESPLRVFLLGAAAGVAERAAANIHRRWTGVQVVGAYSPPHGFERDRAENLRVLARISAARPDVLVIGLGAPKQELWIHEHHAHLPVHVALCVGGTIDVLAGQQPGGPLWIRGWGLEWLHRVASEPRRFAERCARDAWVFPQLVVRAWWQATRGQARARL
jgi:N-acetylglucosaminyldiphosphoundecaprenol N-acetyl-beta-D-mannosaminyltransferase